MVTPLSEFNNSFPLNSLGLAHRFIAEHVHPGDFCIDATAGRGRDTVFLCELVGPQGRVLAMDIQPQATEATQALAAQHGFSDIAEVVCDSHSNLMQYAQPETVQCIVFNFGWLPGGDHHCFTRPETSIPAIEAGLKLLCPDGLMSLCIYSGGTNGYTERDTLLSYLETLDPSQYTVIVARFANRHGDPPIPVFIIKRG